MIRLGNGLLDLVVVIVLWKIDKFIFTKKDISNYEWFQEILVLAVITFGLFEIADIMINYIKRWIKKG